MRVEAKSTFLKDLEKIDSQVVPTIKNMLHEATKSNFFEFCQKYDIKKIWWHNTYWRIKFGQWRIGVKIDNDGMTCMRCKHRKDIYKIFP